jgi:lipopolysaccharide export system protein LptA
MRTGVIIFGVVTATSYLIGQTAPNPSSGAALTNALKETAKILDTAKSTSQAEGSRLTTEQLADTKRIERLAAQATGANAQPSAAEKAMTSAADNKLNAALKDVSPEGKILIAQSAAAPAMRAPDSEELPAKSAAPAEAVKPKPNPAEKPVDAPEGAPIHITCQGATYIDSKQSLTVFTDDVIVDHPQFHMTCDVMEVYMLKDSDKKPAASATGAAAAKTAPSSSPLNLTVAPPTAGGAAPVAGTPATTPAPQDNGIKVVYAKGRKVVILKTAETGEMQTGICKHATYIGESGDIIMREMPQVQRGKNVIIATSPATVMTLKASGELKVQGPNKVDIIQEAAKAPAPAGGVAAQANPGTAPATAPKPQVVKP